MDNIEHIESNTVNGQVIVKVFLQRGTTLAIANAQVTATSQNILRNLPPGTPPPIILNYSASAVPILQLALSGNGLSEHTSQRIVRSLREAALAPTSFCHSISPTRWTFGGGSDESVAAAREEAQATAADLQNATLILKAELAFDYFELHSADAQKQLLDATVKAYTDALQLTTNRFEGGCPPKSDVAQAQTQLETTRVQDTDIGAQRAQFEHAIAILIGKPPAQFSLAPSPLNLQPPTIPVGVPSELLERRPDIAAFERRVAEANEQIGIARAAFCPTVVLGGTGGFEGNSITSWLNWPSRLWAVEPTAVQTLFDAGRRRATSEGAIANYNATLAGYRETALTAFQQVEDNLAALRILEQEAQQQKAGRLAEVGIFQSYRR